RGRDFLCPGESVRDVVRGTHPAPKVRRLVRKLHKDSRSLDSKAAIAVELAVPAISVCSFLFLGLLFGALERASFMSRVPLTTNQRRGFLAAWGGWVLDGMDSFIYALVMVPALRELLPRSGITAD